MPSPEIRSRSLDRSVASMHRSDDPHRGEWIEELDQLRQRYASPIAFAYEWWRYNAPLFDHIRATVAPPARVVEVGTGTGALSILLSGLGYDVLGIDKEPAIVESAREL